MLKSIVRALLKVLFRVHVEGDTSHFSQPRLLIIANLRIPRDFDHRFHGKTITDSSAFRSLIPRQIDR